MANRKNLAGWPPGKAGPFRPAGGEAPGCARCCWSYGPRHGRARRGITFTGQFERLEILEQPGVLRERGFGKGQVTSVGRRYPPKRFLAPLRLENGRVALEVDVEEG